MEKETLLAKLEELLKDIHTSNNAIKRLAVKAIEFVCSEPGKKEYEVMVHKKDEDYFHSLDPWESNSIFKAIFKDIGINISSVSSGVSSEGEYITLKF
jgi:hypothetical protein